MSLIDKLSDSKVWNEFIKYEIKNGNLPKRLEKDLISFVANKEYIPVVEKIPSGFGVPHKKLIGKPGTDKKHVVYRFDRAENYVLKLFTFLLLRKYDHCFSKNLYSFRVNHGILEAVRYLRSIKDLSSHYVCKLDISDYFSSINVENLIVRLKVNMPDDLESVGFIESLLSNPNVRLPNGEIGQEKKGIMAGVPISAFLANFHLSAIDSYFQKSGIKYMRYFDDIIIFSETKEESMKNEATLRLFLEGINLDINENNVLMAEPGEKWSFLGISYQNGIFDVSELSIRNYMSYLTEYRN